MVLLTHHPAFESAVLESSVCQRPLRKIILLFPTRAQILFSCPPSSLRFRGRRPHAELQEEHPDCLIQSWPHMPPAMDMGPYQGNMRGFPGSSVGKESACSSGDLGSIPRSGRSPGEGNDNPSSILAWRIPWTEVPVGLQSMGSQRVGHDFTFTFTFTFYPYI